MQQKEFRLNNRPAGLHPPPQTGITPNNAAPNNAAPNSVVPNQRRSKQRSPEPVSLRAHPHSLKTLAVRPCLHSFKQRNLKPAPHSASLAPPRPAAQSQHLHRPSPGINAASSPILRRHKPHAPVHTAPAYRLLPAAPVPLPLSKPGIPAPRHTFPATFRGLRPACNG